MAWSGLPHLHCMLGPRQVRNVLSRAIGMTGVTIHRYHHEIREAD